MTKVRRLQLLENLEVSFVLHCQISSLTTLRRGHIGSWKTVVEDIPFNAHEFRVMIHCLSQNSHNCHQSVLVNQAAYMLIDR